MTPEVVAAIMGGIALILTSVGTLVAGIIAARRGGRILEKAVSIEDATNGASKAMEADRTALREEVRRLEKEIVERTAEAVMERLASQQAASDVRAAMNTPEKEPAKGKGRKR